MQRKGISRHKWVIPLNNENVLFKECITVNFFCFNFLDHFFREMSFMYSLYIQMTDMFYLTTFKLTLNTPNFAWVLVQVESVSHVCRAMYFHIIFSSCSSKSKNKRSRQDLNPGCLDAVCVLPRDHGAPDKNALLFDLS